MYVLQKSSKKNGEHFLLQKSWIFVVFCIQKVYWVASVYTRLGRVAGIYTPPGRVASVYTPLGRVASIYTPLGKVASIYTPLGKVAPCNAVTRAGGLHRVCHLVRH